MGTGDGRFVLDQAKSCPNKLCIGIDAVASAMAESSHRAASKPKRGGLTNVLFVNASVETLPAELNNIATEITINYPWGSLLKALIQPDEVILNSIAMLAQNGATITILINYSIFADRDYVERLGLPHFDVNDLDKLAVIYNQIGISIERWTLLGKEVPHKTTWGQKLIHGTTRTTLLIQAKKR